jgi:hypothetical protein
MRRRGLFEHKTQRLLSRAEFMRRMARFAAAAGLVIVGSLAVGMAGYHAFEHLGWLDAFLNSAMLLGGMGPITVPVSAGGKVFAALYALYCGLVVILVAGLILAPLAHRFLHRFHLEERG